MLWKRSKQHSRFQARLTILFFLFILIPTVPLTLFVSVLLTRSAEFLLIPGVEDALSESLEVMRLQLEEKGRRLVGTYPNIQQLNPSFLAEYDIWLVRTFRLNNGEIESISIVKKADSLAVLPVLLRASDWENVIRQDKTSSVLNYKNRQFLETYHVGPDSTIIGVCYPIDTKISQARQEISLALSSYTSLSLLKDTFIEEGWIWGLAVFFIILLVMIALYIARVMSKGISEPIQQLTMGMEQIGTGDLSHRVDVKAKDELAFLVSSFNRMAEDLKISRENLQKAERAAAWRDVARRVSHEIKNPLTPIQISLYRLRSSLPEKYHNNQDFDEAFRTIMEELQALRRLANEFSEFARMPQISPTREDVNDIIRSSARLFEAETRKVSFSLELDTQIPPIQLDRELFKRAVNNLLKNAIEASESDGKVVIRTEALLQGNRQVSVKVIDNGCGMSPEIKDHAFEPYFTTKKGGTGLGLAIVQRIVSEHGGTVSIDAEENQGTVITIEL